MLCEGGLEQVWLVPAKVFLLALVSQPFAPAVQDLLCPLHCIPSLMLVSSGFLLQADLSPPCEIQGNSKWTFVPEFAGGGVNAGSEDSPRDFIFFYSSTIKEAAGDPIPGVAWLEELSKEPGPASCGGDGASAAQQT